MTRCENDSAFYFLLDRQTELDHGLLDPLTIPNYDSLEEAKLWYIKKTCNILNTSIMSPLSLRYTSVGNLSLRRRSSYVRYSIPGSMRVALLCTLSKASIYLTLYGTIHYYRIPDGILLALYKVEGTYYS